MAKPLVSNDPSTIPATLARSVIALVAVALILLASLHVLSPEFSPSWRMISEYALGHYGWVLSLFFLAWGLSSWALAATIWSQIQTKAGKVGLWFLLVAGLGQAMASIFDVTHDTGHNIAGLLGTAGFPVAAVLITRSLSRSATWASAKRSLKPLAHLTWISVVVFIVSMIIMTAQFTHANGGKLPDHAPTTLPEGVIGLSGYTDRLMVIANCLWASAVAWWAIKLKRASR